MRAEKLRSNRAGNAKRHRTMEPLHRAALVLGLMGAAALAACGSSSTGTTEPTPAPTWQLEELAANQGVSIRVPSFEVPAGHEEQSCYFMSFPDINGGQDVFVNRIRLAMNVGSHHMNIFRVKTLIDLRPENGEPIKLGPYDATVVRGHDDYHNNPCWGSANWADWPLVANTEVGHEDRDALDWRLPDGVATRFSPGEQIMIQTHYVNTAIQPTTSGFGKVGINFYTAAPGSYQEMGTLFATQQSIRICASNPAPTFSGTCRFPGNVTITAANGHFHSRGKTFTMFTWDGATITHPEAPAQFYQSQRWDNPPMSIGIERPVQNGGGIWWDCAYQWTPPIVSTCTDVDAKDPDHQGDCCYTFGGNTDVGEHCNVFLYYYPKVGATDVFCN
jgi:hypothetical protein